MCDLDRVLGFLIAAKTAFLATLVALGIAMLNSASLFAAAANVPLMVGVIAGAAVATAMYTAALVEMDRCATESCSTELGRLRERVAFLLASMGVYTGLLIGLVVVAAVPFAGAVAVGSVLAWGIAMTMLVTALAEMEFARMAGAYNNCRASAGARGLGGAVIILAYFVTFVAALVSIGGGLAGRLPWQVTAGW